MSPLRKEHLTKVGNVLFPVSYTHLDVYKRQGMRGDVILSVETGSVYNTSLADC